MRLVGIHLNEANSLLTHAPPFHPHSAGVLERAVRALHFNVDPKRSAKQQALELLPKLSEQFPIARAAMRFKVQARREADFPPLRAAAACGGA